MNERLARAAAWFEDRTGWQRGLRHFLFEEIPVSAGWPHVFGSVALFVFSIQALTGILLALNYAPTAAEAYTSLTYIVHQVAGGRLMHGLHHWGSSLIVIVVFIHMAQVFIFGAFRKPREVTWLAGLLLLLLTFAFGLTGYLLPWDNKAYWATVVTTNIAAGVPVAGPLLTSLAGAKTGVGAVTFARFYALHTLVLPVLTASLISLHVYLVRRHGITPGVQRTNGNQTFYPRQLFRDFCAVFVAFTCLFLAACFWDVPLEAMANANDTSYVPRPEWYFLFLFQLLKVFPGRLELIGTVVLPSLALLTLVLLPFLNRIESGILRSRIRSTCVVALVFLGWSALTVAAAFSDRPSKAELPKPRPAEQWSQIPPEVIAGYGYFTSRHCDSCHDLIVGPPKPAPTLGLAALQQPRDWLHQHFSDRSLPGSSGTGASTLTIPQRNALVVFVATIKPQFLTTLPSLPPQVINGAQTFVSSACASCHKVNGIGGASGPSLNGVRDRRSDTWIRAHFIAPRKLSPGSVMPPYRFNGKDEDDLIRYLLSLPE